MTGDVFRQGSLEYTDQIVWLLDTYLTRKRQNNKRKVSKLYLTDEEVLEKARSSRQAPKFKKLWSGDFSDYPSHSEADSALCSILAFYCSGDNNQIDKLFRKSSLFRAKWDEYRGALTYGELTIQKVIESCQTFYRPIFSSPFTDFNNQLTRLKQLGFPLGSKYPWTDIGASQIAKRLTQDKVLTPSAYYKEQGIKTRSLSEEKYHWHSKTVANLLDSQEYIGDLVNFKTYKSSFKSKKMKKNDKKDWHVFQNYTKQFSIRKPLRLSKTFEMAEDD